MNTQTLAILSGIGAAAGLHMAIRLVEVAQEHGAKTDADFPDFVLYNLPSEATDGKGITDERVLGAELNSAMRKFNVWGCDYLLLACNTIHHYLPELKGMFGGLIIDIIDLASQSAQPANCVGVICSATTRQSGLYEAALKRHNPSVDVIYPDDAGQDYVTIAIEAAIRGDKPTRYWKGLHALANSLQQRGADWVILGCTELPLCLKGHALNGFVIDAGELGVREAYRLLSGGAPS